MKSSYQQEMLMFGRTRSHSYTINIAGHITVTRNYLKFRTEFGYHGFLTAQLNSPTKKTRPLIEQAKLATIVQKLTGIRISVILQ